MKDFIKWYLKKGFGSMNKNDFEVFIFNEWFSETQNKDKTDYAISRELRIPESKVKRLKYEASLVYSDDSNEESLKEEFLVNLQKAKYKQDSQKLYFLIPNKLVRQYINNILEKDGRFLESSLTSSSVSIFIDDFIFIVEKLQLVDEKELIKKAKEESEKNHGFPIEWNEILKNFAKGLANDKLGEFTTEAIIKSVNKIINKPTN